MKRGRKKLAVVLPEVDPWEEGPTATASTSRPPASVPVRREVEVPKIKRWTIWLELAHKDVVRAEPVSDLRVRSSSGITVIRKGRDWIETLLIRVTGKGWDTLSAAEQRIEADRWEAEQNRFKQTLAKKAECAARQTKKKAESVERKAAIAAREAALCAVCGDPVGAYVSVWRQGGGQPRSLLCDFCDYKLESDFKELKLTQAANE